MWSPEGPSSPRTSCAPLRSTLPPIPLIPRKYRLALLVVLPAVAACVRSAPTPEAQPAAPPSWSQQLLGVAGGYEFFVDFPVLPAGEEVLFAMHVTRLADGAPMPAGRLEIHLEEGGESVSCGADAPAVPGHWMPRAVLPTNGRWQMTVAYDGVELVLGELLASDDPAEAQAAQDSGPSPDAVVLLKEQQWPVRLRTEAVGMRVLEERIPVVVHATPVPAASAVLHAPAFGRLEAVEGQAWPRLGERVERDQLLGHVRMSLLPGDPATREATRLMAADARRAIAVGAAGAEAALAAATARLQVAEASFERVEQLYARGARSRGELEVAEHERIVAEAEARAAARTRDAWEEASASLAGEDEHAELVFELRAPYSGIVVEADHAPGAWVAGGEKLLHVVDTARLRYGVRMHVDDLVRLDAPRTFVRLGNGGTLELPGPEGALLLSRPPVDPGSHVGELVYEAPAPDGLLPGSVLQAQVSLGAAREVLAVPTSALVDEGGLDVVFVQVGGEAFERRVLRVGMRGLEAVEVIEGLEPGERVVVDGAYTVRLAALSGAIPEHHHH